MRGIPVADLQTSREVHKQQTDKTEVKAEDLVGLISESRRKLFQGSNFGFQETTTARSTDFEFFGQGAGLTTIKTFLPSSEGECIPTNLVSLEEI